MPDLETVRAIAREKMGLMSRGATGEFALLARLLGPDEPILAMAFGKLPGWNLSGRIVAATPQRLLIVAKAMITRRERVLEIALSDIKSARVRQPSTLELEHAGATTRLTFVDPPAQLSALAGAARGRRAGDARFEELDELLRRKLGRVLSFGRDGSLVALAEELGPDEAVVDVALWAGTPGGLVVACDSRLVAIPDKGVGSGPPISVPFEDIAEIHEDDSDLVVRTRDGEHRFEDLAPPDRAGVIAQRIRARVR